MSQYAVLVARLQNELTKLDQVVNIATNQSGKGQQSCDPDFFQAAALSLQNYYMGAERIFEEVAKQIDQMLPTGPASHKELLEQMGLTIPQTRPPLLAADTVTQLNEYRAFRHVVIHRYGFELHPDRVQALVERLPACHGLFRANVEEFCQVLLKIDQAL